MNREAIRQQLSGRGPFIIHTSDGEKISVPGPKSVLVGRWNLVIEDKAGAFDIIDPLCVVSICPVAKRKRRKAGR